MPDSNLLSLPFLVLKDGITQFLFLSNINLIVTKPPMDFLFVGDFLWGGGCIWLALLKPNLVLK
jgi:hypothetical protein